MTKQQKLVLLVSILASFVVFLEGSIVSVALPAISAELGGGLKVQQWVVDSYLITLGALILIAGSLSDLFGRKKVLAAGLIGFAITSVLCTVAPNAAFLIASRVLQGMAGALIVPSSLALIIANFSGPSEGKAIGSWTAWTGIAFIVGLLLGGFLVDTASWRLIYAINLVPIAITLWLMRSLGGTEKIQKHTKVDWFGAMLCVAGLGGPVYALIEQPHYGWGHPLIYIPLVLGVVAFISFLLYERRISQPMLSLDLFKERNFSVGNMATVAIYAALSVSGFLMVVFLQQVGHYSATASGLGFLPVTILMLVLSSRFGALASKYGPRLFMAIGPMIAAAGFLYMLFVDQSVNYWLQLFPGIVLFGLGLSITVAPLTAAVLSSIDTRQAGVGSAVNNSIARIAGLVAVASIGIVTGPVLSVGSFHRALTIMAVLLVLGGFISAIGIKNPARK